MQYINITLGFVLLALSAVMLMIPIQASDQWHKLRVSRKTLSAAYILLGSLMITNGLMGAECNSSSGMFSLIIAFYQALLYTKVCILFLKPCSFDQKHYKRLLYAVSIYNICLISSYALNLQIFTYLFYVGIALYALLLIFCSYTFTRSYNETLKLLEYVFDEDMHIRILWIRRCFFSALLVGIMVWFMIIFYESQIFNALGILVFSLYYLCMVGHFMHYLSKYSFIVNIDHKVAEQSAPIIGESHGKTHYLAKQLNEWVEKKGFRHSDKTIDDIVEELNTTRSDLNAYMNATYNVNFRTWRNRLRIEDAKQLLTDGKIPVAEIYIAVGYSDRSNFHRQFAESTGLTPLQYRRLHKPQ